VTARAADRAPEARVTVRAARAQIGAGQLGVVYVLCFDRPYSQRRGARTVAVRHYIGWSSSRAMLKRRLSYHAEGRGARLLAAVAAAGITWRVVAIFPAADRHFERWLHAKARTPDWCPRCQHTRRHVRRLAAVLAAPVPS
jgi:hypothetical protein